MHGHGTKLKKELNALDVFSLASGAMISSGIFVLPAIAYKEAGSSVLISYFLAGILMLPALFSKLELTTAIPKAGGTYFYTERILGTAAGVVNGLANWFSISLKSAFALLGIGIFATIIFPDLTELQIKLIAATCCIIFALINLYSVESSGKLQLILVAFLLLILTQFVITGYRKVDFVNFNNVFDIDLVKIFSTTGMIFISYGGLTKVASVAEEVKNPRKNLALGMVSAFLVVQTLYLLVVFTLIGILPSSELAASLTPVTDAAAASFSNVNVGRIFLSIAAIAGMLAFITTANAGIMAASRSPMAMSRDGLIPSFLSRVTKKKKIPYISIIITTLFMLFIIFGLPLKKLVKVASLFMILLFVMVNISVIVIRMSKISNYKPTFKTPFYPVPQILGVVLYLILIFQMGLFTILVAFCFIILSLIWYYIYARKKVKRKSAFLHMVENITGPDFIEEENKLEDELLDILIERDEIVEDRFDKIIRNSIVLDLHETIDRDELFRVIAGKVAERWGLDAVDIEKKLNKREEDASTLIYPGVAIPHAIPHVVINGKHKFDIVLVRNKFGIKWNEKDEVVYTAFCLIGTHDERNFHLRALMFIAQILQDPDYHTEWMNARNEKELKSVILLTKRRRK